jgi:hypothetical protein
MEQATHRRPGPLRWLLYAFGRGLPAEYRDWVLHDLTTDSWPVRQMLRSAVQMLPFVALLVLVIPGELWVRLVGAGGGALVGLLYALAFLEQSTEHRALKAGYPRGTLTAVRESLHADERAAARARYNARWRRTELPPTGTTPTE